jgi:hypothetical protein
MRCLRCGLVVAIGVEFVTGTMKHEPCAWVHNCTDADEPALPPSLHVPDDSDHRIEIHDGRAYADNGGSVGLMVPINLRFNDTFEFKYEVLMSRS